MKIAVIKEQAAREARVAITPETVKKYRAMGLDVAIERGAGEGSSIPDSAYEQAGAQLCDNPKETLAGAHIFLAVQAPERDLLALLPKKALLVGLLSPHENADLFKACAAHGVDAYSMELVPRISRAQTMDALSSQSNLAGYRAVIEAASLQQRVLPMMMTAAGTVTPCKALILGAGVAGLQAIATARRLGAVVSAFDVRPAVKEQVQSLGASFVEVPADDPASAETAGGYAKEMGEAYKARQQEAIFQAIRDADIVISTALIPGKPAPVLITRAMVESMLPGSVIIDMAAIAGGNCALTKTGKTITHQGVMIVGETNYPARVAADASRLYARNLHALLGLLVDKEKKTLQFNMDDPVVKDALIVHGGQIIHPAYAQAAPKPAAMEAEADAPRPAPKRPRAKAQEGE